MASRDFVSAKELLPRLLGRLAREGGPSQPLQGIWAREAGPQLARHARVLALQHDVLHLSVTNNAWAQAIAKQEATLCARLTDRIGPPGVRGLRMRIA